MNDRPNPISASVLVRAHNDEAFVKRTLEAVFAQKAPFPFEVLVCDDASTDRTREIAARFPVRFVERPAGPYKPGKTLNALVRAATGDIAVFDNADAIPQDRDWLANLVRPLLAEGGRTVFSFANQLPRPDATALVRKDMERAFGDGRVQATWRFFFSLASSATWRNLLLETPFDETCICSEDVEWTWRASHRPVDPVRVVYCPDALVEHSHNYTLRQLAKRFRGEGADARRIFGDRPSLPRALFAAARTTAGDWLHLLPHPRNWPEIPGAPVRRLVQHVSHWKGTRTPSGAASDSSRELQPPLRTLRETKKVKTLFYIEDTGVRGGIEVFAERHAARLRAEGREVQTVSDVPADFSAWDEVVVHKCSDAATLERFPPEKTTLYVHDHDPVCPRSYAYTPLRRNCTRASGLWPCLFCAPLCRHPGAALDRVLAQKRRKRTMARLAKIVVLSDFMKSRLVANGIPAEKISVEPPEVPAAAGGAAPAEAVDLLFVGQLIRGKGVQLLLQAMARMKTRRTLDVVGAGNLEPELRALAEKLGVADRVRFRGFRENPQAWMRAAACVVVPSFWQEPYGLVAAEAISLGRPVVAFAIGGLPEACGGKATLVPPGDIAALARALDATPYTPSTLP